MNVIDTPLEGVKIIEPSIFADTRGFFMESWNARSYAEFSISPTFVQDNHSKSNRGVLRGLHYQKPQSQGKLVRVAVGSVFDVAVDIRRSSPTFGCWFGVELSAENKRQFWIPQGFAHGFLCLEDGSEFLYKCTNYYAPNYEHSIRWDDPNIGIEWPLDGIDPSLSGKDLAGVLLADAEVFP